MTLYRIADWSKRYENNRSRLIKKLDWVPVPNSHDGEAYARIMARKDAAEVFATWILLLQIASRCDPRGMLVRDNGQPLDAQAFSFKTRAPESWFTKSVPVLVDIGWVLRNTLADNDTAPDCHDGDAQLTFIRQEGGTEGNGREGKEEKGKEAATPMPLPFSSDAFKAAWELFQTHRSEIRKPLKPTSAQMALKQLAAMGEQRAIRCIEHTIAKGWQGLREPDAQAPAMAAQRPSVMPYREPMGWKTYLNHTYPESVYSVGGDKEAHQWADLPRDVQGKIAGEIGRQNRE